MNPQFEQLLTSLSNDLKQDFVERAVQLRELAGTDKVKWNAEAQRVKESLSQPFTIRVAAEIIHFATTD